MTRKIAVNASCAENCRLKQRSNLLAPLNVQRNPENTKRPRKHGFEVQGSNVRGSRFDSSLSPRSTVRSVHVRQFAQSTFDSSLSPGSTVRKSTVRTVRRFKVRQFASPRFEGVRTRALELDRSNPRTRNTRTLKPRTPNVELPTSNSQSRTPNLELRTSNSDPRT